MAPPFAGFFHDRNVYFVSFCHELFDYRLLPASGGLGTSEVFFMFEEDVDEREVRSGRN